MMTETVSNEIPKEILHQLKITPDTAKIEFIAWLREQYGISLEQAEKIVGVGRSQEWFVKPGDELGELTKLHQEIPIIREFARRFEAIGQLISITQPLLALQIRAVRDLLEMLIEPSFANEQKLSLSNWGIGLTRKMERTINLLSDIIAVERGDVQMKVEAVDPQSLITATISTASELAEQNFVKLSFEVSENLPKIWGDTAILQKALLNIILNIRFDKAEAKIEITCFHENQGIIIRIADNGDGIPAAVSEVFIRRVESGLSPLDFGRLEVALGQYLIQKNGGEIYFEHNYGKGSVTTIKLPIRV
jgi:signal transduction histidine kinase